MSFWYDKKGKLLALPLREVGKERFIEDMAKVGKLLLDRSYKIIKQETLPNGYWVSTVWLGLDHDSSWYQFDKPNPTPLIFETMVFPSPGDYSELDTSRYSTEAQARKGHERMVKKWSKKSAPRN